MKGITGNLNWLLRLEGLTLLTLSTVAFAHYGIGWKVFALLFLIPDLALIGYLLSNKAGAILYNLTHALIGPACCLCLGLIISDSQFMAIGFIWSAHIGFDRSLGYGLKYSAGFRYTHLGTIGK
ncbi:DUF4260 family protein [Marinomonas posidonica]|uniref:DUF4260 domain-containing protein n=1 Tax=Marinomonas posidonica (strain CECT 7376 / NCIMB 14433 / IVIA-Po-181) TaxID=491952 RepID=F6CTC0_MARPP|nr:DUF4260 family protein [Marinomonas posidonica]AEF56286.1 hypothetical protein Mar181_3265 [Marinomonas posidonica IVIA-Po-181]